MVFIALDLVEELRLKVENTLCNGEVGHDTCVVLAESTYLGAVKAGDTADDTDFLCGSTHADECNGDDKE